MFLSIPRYRVLCVFSFRLIYELFGYSSFTSCFFRALLFRRSSLLPYQFFSFIDDHRCKLFIIREDDRIL